MHVAYVALEDAQDRRAFSGTNYFMAEALRAQAERLSFVGPLRERWALPLKVKQQLYRSLLRKEHQRMREPLLLEGYADQALRRLEVLRPSVAIGPSTLPFARLDAPCPTVFWTDATFAGMVDFYPEFTNLSRATIRNGNRMEQEALKRCSLAIFSSEWAAHSALTHYEVDPAKVKVVPFGANLDAPPESPDVETYIENRPSDHCHLLFLGKDWVRKGGPLVLALAERLNRRGLPTTLTIVGCTPPLPDPRPAFVRLPGFLDKSTDAGREAFEQLLAQTHFLVLPARADCTPIVFCEASAYGIPSLSTEAGGIPTTICHGRNGLLFPLDTPVDAYADAVLDLFSEAERYHALARSARIEFETRLNWNTAGQTVYSLLEAI